MKQHFDILNDGNFSKIVAKTPKAKKWLKENVQTEKWQWNGDGSVLYLDTRCIFPISEAIKEAFA